MIKKLVIGVAVVLSANAFAQNNFVPGYILSNESDTIKVEIKYNEKKPLEVFEKVSIKVTDPSIKTFKTGNYKPGKIKGFGMNGDDYVSKKVEGVDVFLKIVSAGALNLYEHKVEVLQMNKEKVESDYYIEKQSGSELVKLKSGKFKKQLSDLVIENEDLVKDIADKKYEYENVKDLVEEYNNWAKEDQG